MKHKLFGLIGILTLAVLRMGSMAGATVCGTTECLVNSGFETGDLTGWTLSGTGVNKPGDSWSVWQGFWSGSTDPFNLLSLSQTISTETGALYHINFSLTNFNWGGDPLGEFKVSFGGVTLLDLMNQSDFGPTAYSFTVAGAPVPADLTFASYNLPGMWWLTNVGVIDDPAGGTPAAVPEPSTWLLLGCGLAGLAIWRRKQTATA